MKVNANASQILALAVAAVGLYAAYKVVEFIKENAPDKNTFNPVSDKNLAYRAVSAPVAVIAGDEHATLGTAFYELAQWMDSRIFGLGKTDGDMTRQTTLGGSSAERIALQKAAKQFQYD